MLARVSSVWLALLVFTSSQANAQQICEAIIKAANYNQYRSVSQSQQYALQKANFCLAEYDKASTEQKTQIEAAGKGFGISLGGGKSEGTQQISERQRQECHGQYGEYWFSQLGTIDQKVVSDKALSTVADCLRAYAAGLRIEPNFSETERVLSISLNWVRPTPLKVRAIKVAPESVASCKFKKDGATSNATTEEAEILPGGTLTVICERIPQPINISGETVTCYPDGLIVLDTTENPTSINLFRRCDTDFLLSRAKAVDAEIGRLRAQLIELRQYSDKINAKTPRLDCTDVTVVGNKARCADGYKAVSCTAGNNYASHAIEDGYMTCKTASIPAATSDPANWTTAHCCRAILE